MIQTSSIFRLLSYQHFKKLDLRCSTPSLHSSEEIRLMHVALCDLTVKVV
ncbi:hypothetical protein K788_0007674 [Paraburkholderia caribensis MBA4]|uniref:Uncharacterized protein n=1 Tax=Paraburkholderia caribensis MBA4 TaxID=1323664 RepID=A0A0P0RGE7_9BURK|nr:hypothetical protein K788_0007674 [Paraburkholderia caribensis MBA4]